MADVANSIDTCFTVDSYLVANLAKLINNLLAMLVLIDHMEDQQQGIVSGLTADIVHGEEHGLDIIIVSFCFQSEN